MRMQFFLYTWGNIETMTIQKSSGVKRRFFGGRGKLAVFSAELPCQPASLGSLWLPVGKTLFFFVVVFKILTSSQNSSDTASTVWRENRRVWQVLLPVQQSVLNTEHTACVYIVALYKNVISYSAHPSGEPRPHTFGTQAASLSVPLWERVLVSIVCILIYKHVFFLNVIKINIYITLCTDSRSITQSITLNHIVDSLTFIRTQREGQKKKNSLIQHKVSASFGWTEAKFNPEMCGCLMMTKYRCHVEIEMKMRTYWLVSALKLE